MNIYLWSVVGGRLRSQLWKNRYLLECRWRYGVCCGFGRLSCVGIVSKTTGDKLPVVSQVIFGVGQVYIVHGLKTSFKSLSLSSGTPAKALSNLPSEFTLLFEAS